jgi:fumarylacetoacetate (FAA) hydrolase family protein
LGQIKAEVVEISKSKYGCKKYKVKYDDKRGNWNFTFEREWLMLKELTKIK